MNKKIYRGGATACMDAGGSATHGAIAGAQRQTFIVNATEDWRADKSAPTKIVCQLVKKPLRRRASAVKDL